MAQGQKAASISIDDAMATLRQAIKGALPENTREFARAFHHAADIEEIVTTYARELRYGKSAG